ncbi:MAG: hypothetical protein Fur005_23640 [Roseiflexaceae bacterium]
MFVVAPKRFFRYTRCDEDAVTAGSEALLVELEHAADAPIRLFCAAHPTDTHTSVGVASQPDTTPAYGCSDADALGDATPCTNRTSIDAIADTGCIFCC